MTKEFKVNDWVFCEFKLQLIKEVKDGAVTSVTDGRFSLGSNSLNDRCFHLDIKIKCLSDTCSYWYDRFHRECRQLNFPDMNRKMIELWVNACNDKDDDKKLVAHYNTIDNFAKSVITQYEKAHNEMYIDGVRLFR